jgi:hypothetical protein
MAGEEYLLALGHIPQDTEEISQAWSGPLISKNMGQNRANVDRHT